MPPSASHIAILCNRLAGNGRSLQLARQLSMQLKSMSVQCEVLEAPWPHSLQSFSDVWIVGGDGTLNYFVNQYPSIHLPLMIWNGGTGNDFHWLLYGGLTHNQLWQTALEGEVAYYDAGRCNDRIFLNGIGVGFEGAVAKSLHGKAKLPGKTSFLFTVLKHIAGYKEAYYEIQLPDMPSIHQHCLLLSIMNGRRAGGGFHIAPESAANDGLLDFIWVDRLHWTQRLRYLPVIEKGKHLNLPFVHLIKTRGVRIISKSKMVAHADGEPFEASELNIEILPNRFRFRVPSPLLSKG